MKVNIYFLIVGILSIFFSITHALNGHATVLSLIDATSFETTLKTAVFYVWHVITIENLIFGIVFLIMAFHKEPAKITFTARMIAIIILARWGVIFGSTLLKDIGGIKNTLVDSIAIVIFAGLIILGIRKAKHL